MRGILRRGASYVTTFTPSGRMPTGGCLASPDCGPWAAIALPSSTQPAPRENKRRPIRRKGILMEATAGPDQAPTEKVLNAYSNIEDATTCLRGRFRTDETSGLFLPLKKRLKLVRIVINEIRIAELHL